jgi:hypothetical protein
MRENLDESEIRDRRASMQDLERRAVLAASAAPVVARAGARERRARPWSQSVLAVGLVLAGVAVGLGVAFASGALDGREATGPEPGAPEPTETATVDPVGEEAAPPVSEVVAEDPGPGAPAEPVAEPTVADDTAAESVEVEAPAMRRRARERRPRRTMRATEPAVPVIDEY